MLKLRDYQLETIEKIQQSMHNGHRSIIVQQPPRTGKTVIMAEIARRATLKGNRVLWMVHRKEIVEQARKTFIAHGVDMELVKLGMVQTLTRHVDKLAEPAIIFVDEGHHSTAKSYRRILDHFPNSVKLMFTATPTRLSGEGFEEVADDLIVGKPIKWLIDNGYLAPVDYYAPNSLDISQLKVKRNGEFDEKSIEDAFKPKIYGDVVKTFKKLSSNKQAIAYTYNVKSAERLADMFNQNGITSKVVSGQTKKDERAKIIERYRDGKIQVVTNSELFTEGLDLPNVDTVIMLRPTQSLSLYLQFAMRSMNPKEGKTAIIIDHVGNVNRFGLPTDEREWSLTGSGKVKQAKSEAAPTITTCENCFATFYRKSLTKCPFCGAELSEPEVLEVEADVELHKVERLSRIKEITKDAIMMNVAGKTPAELKSYEEVKAYQKLMHYKPGWTFYYSKKRGFIK